MSDGALQLVPCDRMSTLSFLTSLSLEGSAMLVVTYFERLFCFVLFCFVAL
jgi:hypothetical protein